MNDHQRQPTCDLTDDIVPSHRPAAAAVVLSLAAALVAPLAAIAWTDNQPPPSRGAQEQTPSEPDGQVANPFEGDEQAIAEGAVLFRQNCVGCHGARGRGGKGPDLTDTRWLHGSRDEDIFRVVRRGVRGTTMKQIIPIFNDDKVWQIVAFIRSLARPAADPTWRPSVTGDTAAGKRFYFDTTSEVSCINCHALGGTGGSIGPPLSRIAAIRSPEFLMESLLLPSTDIDPAYQRVVVVTKQGQVITGVRVNEDNFSIQLRDEQLGRYYSFAKSELDAVRVQEKSAMPENLAEQLTVKQLHDLFAYLMTLAPESSETEPSTRQ